MRNSFTYKRILFAAGGFALALFFGGAAFAITDTVFKYPSPTPRNKMYPAAAFGPQNSPAGYSNNGNLHTSGTTTCFTAPVNDLPQGAKISSLAMWYSKNDTETDGFGLFRVNVNTQALDQIALIVVPNSSGAYRKVAVSITDPSFQVIDNNTYVYYINQCLSASETFQAARISYTITNAGQ